MAAKVDQWFILCGLLFAGLGLFMGEHMGSSGDHSQMPTHAHIMLAGWVFAALYGLIYRAWPALKTGVLPLIQFGLHVLGSLSLVAALFFIFGGKGEQGAVIPLVAGGALAIIAAWALFLFHFVRNAGRQGAAVG